MSIATIGAEALAGEVTTVFGNQRLFTDSVRDFYAYLAGIGRPEPTPWDEHLCPAVAAANVAVHEEALVDLLLTDLR